MDSVDLHNSISSASSTIEVALDSIGLDVVDSAASAIVPIENKPSQMSEFREQIDKGESFIIVSFLCLCSPIFWDNFDASNGIVSIGGVDIPLGDLSDFWDK